MRTEVAMEVRDAGLDFDEVRGEELKRQQRVDACINAPDIGALFFHSLTGGRE